MTSMYDSPYVEERQNHRFTVVRRAATMTPLAVACVSLLAWAVAHLPGSIFAVIILSLTSIALVVEAVSALRDLRAQPVTTQGRIARLWKKSRYLFLGRVDYMLVSRQLFEVNAVTATELHEGDEVVVTHWPHSNVIVNIARAPAAPASPPSSQEPMNFGDSGRA